MPDWKQLTDSEGFMKDPADWSPEIASKIANQEGMHALSDDHLKVLHELRRRYLETGNIPVMRRVCREIGLEEHCVSDLLFDPKKAWRIAGLPNPGEEAKAYLESAEKHDK